MMEDGYFMVGYSSFNGGNVDINGSLTQAKRVHASVVIVYSKYTNTVSSHDLSALLPSFHCHFDM